MTDLVLSREARRIALHHRLIRRRRWSQELDRLLAPPIEPWDLAEPIGSINWDEFALGVRQRDLAGHELAVAA